MANLDEPKMVTPVISSLLTEDGKAHAKVMLKVRLVFGAASFTNALSRSRLFEMRAGVSRDLKDNQTVCRKLAERVR